MLLKCKQGRHVKFWRAASRAPSLSWFLLLSRGCTQRFQCVRLKIKKNMSVTFKGLTLNYPILALQWTEATDFLVSVEKEKKSAASRAL
jgi:hypothetical protein